MSAKKPIKGEKAYWRVRQDDGSWKQLGEGEIPNVNIPGYVWAPCIPGTDGMRILHFIMN